MLGHGAISRETRDQGPKTKACILASGYWDKNDSPFYGPCPYYTENLKKPCMSTEQIVQWAIKDIVSILTNPFVTSIGPNLSG